MGRAIKTSEAAARDLRAVQRWLTQPGAGPAAANRLDRIRETIRSLRQAPMRWPVAEHTGIREVSVGGYRVLYEVLPDTGDNTTAGDVSILRVFGPGQDRTSVRQ